MVPKDPNLNRANVETLVHITDRFSSCSPKLYLLKPEGKAVELWLAKVILKLFGFISSHDDFKNIY